MRRKNIDDIELSNSNDKIGDKIYNMFGYPSKIYYRDIEKFIKELTQESDVIFDPMVGSGSTAIAAARTNRHAIINDGSVLSKFIARESIRDINIEEVEKSYERIMSEMKPIVDDMLKSTCNCCGNNITVQNIIQSDIYKCDNCKSEYPLYQNEKKEKSRYRCPNCKNEISLYSSSDKKSRVEKRCPITKKYHCKDCSCKGSYRHEKKILDKDIRYWNNKVSEYDNMLNPWYPEVEVKTGNWYTRKGGWPGIEDDSDVRDLFTDRNLVILGILRQKIQNIDDSKVRKQLMFVLLSCLIRSSNRMYEKSVVKTYYQIPSVGKVQNPLEVFKRKFKNYIEAKSMISRGSEEISIYNQDARDLENIDTNSADFCFIDPPYGSQVGYYVLNEFYTSWLKKSENIDDEIIIPMETDKKEKSADNWMSMMSPVFSEVSRITKDNGYVVLVFHSTSTKIWNNLRKILYNKEGFEYVGYINKDRGTTFHTNRISNTNVSTAYILLRNKYGTQKEVGESLRQEDIEEIKNSLSSYFEDRKFEEREAKDEITRIVNEKRMSKIPEDMNKILEDLEYNF